MALPAEGPDPGVEPDREAGTEALPITKGTRSISKIIRSNTRTAPSISTRSELTNSETAENTLRSEPTNNRSRNSQTWTGSWTESPVQTVQSER